MTTRETAMPEVPIPGAAHTVSHPQVTTPHSSKPLREKDPTMQITAPLLQAVLAGPVVSTELTTVTTRRRETSTGSEVQGHL